MVQYAVLDSHGNPKLSSVIRILWVLNVLFVRLSITLTLLRIVETSRWRYTMYAIMVSMTTIFIVVLALFSARCRPYSYSWTMVDESLGTTGSCFSPKLNARIDWAFSSCDILYNFILALLPLAILWKLKMGRLVKTSIAGLLGLGIVCVIVVQP